MVVAGIRCIATTKRRPIKSIKEDVAMKENKEVGIVKFWCYSNAKNNDQATSSESYRFLKDAIVNALMVYLRDTQEHSINVRFACGCPLDMNNENYQSQQGEPQKSSIVEMSMRDNLGHSLSLRLPDGGNDKANEQEKREEQYVAQDPDYTFDRLIVTDETRAALTRSVRLFDCYDQIFNKWGLKTNSPHPVVAMNFFGPSGTGKTLAAHAIASYLKKKIVIASYAQIESMYHGEGPKNVEAIFRAAEKQNAILFIDEADSLLSRRLTDVRNGSESAVNSMRSQILICLEKFSGIVIFATNLVENYDRAFESRVRSIHFPLPDENCRRQIWAKHLPASLPMSKDLNVKDLAKIDDISGREIRNAVQDVAEQMAVDHLPEATFELLAAAIDRIKKSRFVKRETSAKVKEPIPMTDAEKQTVAEVFDDVLKKEKLSGEEQGNV